MQVQGPEGGRASVLEEQGDQYGWREAREVRG